MRQEIERGEYKLDVPVEIRVMADYKAIYRVGEGRLIHDENGFTLTGCDGQLEYKQTPIFLYSLYVSDDFPKDKCESPSLNDSHSPL